MSSPMNQQSLSRVINEYVQVNNQRRDLEKREKELKDILLSLDQEEVSSARYTIKISTIIRKILDKKSIEKEMGEEWVEKHQKESTGTRLTVRVK